MKTLTVIMGHGDREAQATFERHLPYYRDLGHDMLVVTVTGKPLRTGLDCVALGEAGHHSTAANQRFQDMLGVMLDRQYQYYVFFEYDALCLSRELPEICKVPGMFGNAFQNTDPTFHASVYYHPPLAMNRDTLAAIVQSARQVPAFMEMGFWDRWLGLVLQQGKIPAQSWGRLGFSRNTIEPAHLTDARAAVRGGAVMFHGVKTADTLSEIEEEYARHLLQSP